MAKAINACVCGRTEHTFIEENGKDVQCFSTYPDENDDPEPSTFINAITTETSTH